MLDMGSDILSWRFWREQRDDRLGHSGHEATQKEPGRIDETERTLSGSGTESGRNDETGRTPSGSPAKRSERVWSDTGTSLEARYSDTGNGGEKYAEKLMQKLWLNNTDAHARARTVSSSLTVAIVAATDAVGGRSFR